MEFLILWAVSLLILYHIIRVAVRDGVSEALDRRDRPDRTL